MPISQEELNSVPRETRIVPAFDPTNPNRCEILMQFPTGKSHLWTFTGPDYPITEIWVREAHEQVMARITSDLYEGNPDTIPPMRPDLATFRSTNWESATGAIRKAIEDWVEKRREWADKNAKPIMLL